MVKNEKIKKTEKAESKRLVSSGIDSPQVGDEAILPIFLSAAEELKGRSFVSDEEAVDATIRSVLLIMGIKEGESEELTELLTMLIDSDPDLKLELLSIIRTAKV